MLIGANCHVDWAEQNDPAVRADIRAKLKAMGVTSVRVDYSWISIQPDNATQWHFDELDTYMDEFTEDGLSVLLMLYMVPNWAAVNGAGGKNAVPKNPADFGRLCGAVAARYGAKLAGVEMHNEPDLDGFWAGTPQDFSALLAGAYPVAKSMAPDTLFLAAAPTYLGLASGWFDDMYADNRYRPGVSYDAQAIHPYPSPSDLPPNAPASDWSINGIPELQALRSAHGDTSPLWVTEVGWSTHDSPDDAENWKRGVSEAEQAAYTLGALILLQGYDIAATYLYTDRDMEQTSDPHERNFGLLRTDNSRKPVADLLAAVRNAAPEPPDPPDPPDPGDDQATILIRLVVEAKVNSASPGAVTGSGVFTYDATVTAADTGFTLGTTKPAANNTGVPAGTTFTQTMTSDITYSTPQTITGVDFACLVTLTAPVKFVNCRFRGRDVGFVKYGLVTCTDAGAAGSEFDRCTFNPDYPRWWLNAIYGAGFTANRCNVTAVVDGFHIRYPATCVITGNYFHDFFFSDQSDDQRNSNPPYWTHNDAIQFRQEGASVGQHIVKGNNFHWYPGLTADDPKYDRNAVLYTGVPGSGFPHTMVSTKTNRPVWGCAVTCSPDFGPYPTGVLITQNWFEGGTACFQSNYAPPLSFGEISYNRVGGDQYQYSGGSYQLRWDPAVTVTNYFTNYWDDLPTVLTQWRGAKLTLGQTGASNSGGIQIP